MGEERKGDLYIRLICLPASHPFRSSLSSFHYSLSYLPPLSFLRSALSSFFPLIIKKEIKKSRGHEEMGKGREGVRKPVIIYAILGDIAQIRSISHSMIYRHVISRLLRFSSDTNIGVISPSFLSPFLNLSLASVFIFSIF